MARPVVVPWFWRKEYHVIRQMVGDHPDMPESFDDWEKKASSDLAHHREHGVTAEVATIHPQEFTMWCSARGLQHNVESIRAFATHIATTLYREL